MSLPLVVENKSGDGSSATAPTTLEDGTHPRRPFDPSDPDTHPNCEFCGAKKRSRFQRYMKCTNCSVRPLSPSSITRLRTLMCMTQEAFGRQLGVSRLCVWNWENGLRIPHDRHRRLLMRLAKGNKVKLDVYELRQPAGIAKEP